jgi:signal transduction histidine kinase
MFAAAPPNQHHAHDPVTPLPGAPQSDLQGAMIVVHVAQLVAAEHDIARQMRLVARAAAVVFGGTAALLSFESVTEALVPLAVVDGLHPTAVPFSGAHSGLTPLPLLAAVGLHEGIAGCAARTGAPVVVPDLLTDLRYSSSLAAPDAALLGLAPRAIVALPLRADDQLLGILVAARATPGCDEATLELLRAIAALATLALCGERHAGSAHQAQQRATDARDDERRRLARDLHDGPVQTIANAAMSIEYIDQLIAERQHEARLELRRMHASLLRTASDLRGVLADLRPPLLESVGLAAALTALVERLQGVGGTQIQLGCDLAERLADEQECALYAIIREALTNVGKHARATECWVDLHIVPDAAGIGRTLHVTIRDNGVGFDVAALAHAPGVPSWGMLSLTERAHAIGGTLAIHTQPGHGTTVEVCMTI